MLAMDGGTKKQGATRLGLFCKAKHSTKIRMDAVFCAKNRAIRSNAYGAYAASIPLLSLAQLADSRVRRL
ncbi:MAG: hypothetical protein LBC72_03010 [Spirochaetaceae bacterium]|nr:hypothetical protein [Spirochaetaceae bacterium]